MHHDALVLDTGRDGQATWTAAHYLLGCLFFGHPACIQPPFRARVRVWAGAARMAYGPQEAPVFSKLLEEMGNGSHKSTK
jgi:hypothetical protein